MKFHKTQIAACVFLLIPSLPSAALQTEDRRIKKSRGAWSSEAVSLFNTWGGLDVNPGRKFSLPSPDSEKIVEVKGETVSIIIHGQRYRTKIGQKTNAELGWSPDSRYFFVTWTDGGETGGWHTELYAVSDSGLKKVTQFENHVRADFERRIRHLPMDKSLSGPNGRKIWMDDIYCVANIVGAQWLNGSQELLLSALVPNVGICRYMSTFDVYRVSVPTGRILQRYTAIEAHKKFNPANLPIITR